MIFPPIPRRRVILPPGQFSLIIRQLLSGRLRNGPDRIIFEKIFADQLGVPEAVSFGSGRAALRAICRALNFPPGSEIIVPAYTDKSVPQTLFDLGLKPVFADIEPDSHNLDPAEAAKKITSATRAVIAAHLFGRPCRIREIVELAGAHNLKLIEDCAHSFGAMYHGKPVGLFGDGAFFSFATTKVLGTMGGGMAFCRRPEDTAAVRRDAELENAPSPATLIRKILAAYLFSGLTRRPLFAALAHPLLRLIDDPIKLYDRTLRRLVSQKPESTPGFSNLQAQIGVEKLKAIDQFTGACRRNALRMHELLDPQVQRLSEPEDVESVYYFFILLHARRKQIARDLLKRGVDTGHGLMRHCPNLFDDFTSYPETDRAIAESIQLPIFPLNEKDLRALAQEVNQVFTKDRA